MLSKVDATKVQKGNFLCNCQEKDELKEKGQQGGTRAVAGYTQHLKVRFLASSLFENCQGVRQKNSAIPSSLCYQQRNIRVFTKPKGI